MKKILMAHNFHVLYIDKGKIIQRSIKDIHEIENIVCIEKKYTGINFITLGGREIVDSILGGLNRAVKSSVIQIISQSNGLKSVKIEKNYMRANQNVDIDFEAVDVQRWEQFLFLDINEFFDLKFVYSNKWVSISGKDTFNLDLSRSDISKINFGGIEFETEDFIKQIAGCSEKKFFIINEQWKIHKFFILKPVVVFVVFGDGSAYDQFKLSIESLNNPGNYDGNIIVVTNLEKEKIYKISPNNFKDKIKIVSMYAQDRLDFVGARLSIFTTDFLDSFQPIIYSDADVIFDKEVKDFLRIGAMADKCSAQVENFHLHKESEHVGGSLFQQDLYELENVYGFNGGILLVPNMVYHKDHLRACYLCLHNYVINYGRDSIPFYDQSVLNYVLYKMHDFSPSPVTEMTQVGGDEHQSIRAMYELDPRKPKGFVHFWNTANRVEEMSAYLEKIKC